MRARVRTGARHSVLSACGSQHGGRPPGQDEPSGNFPVEVIEASFPLQQKLAESSTMKIVVRNAGDEAIPNIAVTVQCTDSKDGQNGSFDRQIEGYAERRQEPARPSWSTGSPAPTPAARARSSIRSSARPRT